MHLKHKETNTKTKERHRTIKPWFSCFLRNPVRKWSRPILITLQPGMGSTMERL